MASEPEPPSQPEAPSAWVRWRHAVGVAVLALAVAFSTWTRIDTGLSDPGFDRTNAAALLRTDPAFLYYLTERIVEAGGGIPADFRADPNVEYPDVCDVPAMFTVGQEFVTAWTWMALGREPPLHVVAVWVMALFASLVLVGMYGVALELTGEVKWACLAALLGAVLLGNYRTIGYVLIREDFGFPFFGVHAWLALRAARTRTAVGFGLAGLFGALAAAFWHATGFVLLMEMACLLGWYLRSGRGALEGRAWIAVAAAALVSLAVPVLRAKLFVLSFPMQIALALLIAAPLARRLGPGALRRAGAALGAVAVFFALAKLATAALGAGLSDYGHVVELLVAKLTRGGTPPADPGELTFGTRLLWQGPFKTADWQVFAYGLTAGMVGLGAGALIAAPTWWRGAGDGRFAVVVAFGLVATLSTWLVERTQLVLGFVTPAITAAVCARVRPRALGLALIAAAILGHGVYQARLLSRWQNPWYQPVERNRELAHLCEWITANVPEGEPIASDFLTSAAILAHTRHPILQQPKYETTRSREKIEAYFDAFFQRTPAELRAHVRGLGARWLVVDRNWMGGNAYVGGVRPEELPRRTRTAAWALLSPDPRTFGSIPGYELVYSSPPRWRWQSYRVYRLE